MANDKLNPSKLDGIVEIRERSAQHGPLKTEDLDGRSQIFGWRRERRGRKGERLGDLVHLYVEDDGAWHWVTSFDEHWLPNVLEAVQGAAGVKPYAGPAKYTAAERARGNLGIRWINATGVAGRPTLHDVLDYLDERTQEEDGSWEGLDSAGGLAVRLLARMTETPLTISHPAKYTYDHLHIGRFDGVDWDERRNKLATREIQRSPAFKTDDEWYAYAEQVCDMLNAAERAGRLMSEAQRASGKPAAGRSA